ncbi:MAG: hypothetical protein EXQ55_02365 [Acidobacteria bacterium]|nr:hypothetical protein [Acidobacteriota bacterium]
MDDVVNRLARELADAIAAAVADDPQVEECRERARAAGFEMKVTLEAVVGFVNRTTATEKGGAIVKVPTAAKVVSARRASHMTANDRRFLRSLRISADEAKKEEVE